MKPITFDYKTNDIFRGDFAYRHLNACVGDNGGPYNFYDYSKGYFGAGQKLALKIIADPEPRTIDLLIYPIIFTYRHAIELALKHMSIVLPAIWEEEESISFTHNLLDNWRSVKIYLQREPSIFDTDDQLIDKFDKFITDFVEIDPKGDAFRYPFDKKGQRHLEDMSLINIKVFNDIVTSIGEILQYWFFEINKLKTFEYNPDNY